jgi:hypothetical protein
MYQAPNTTPERDTTAITLSCIRIGSKAGDTSQDQARWNMPARRRNSPANPFNPGNPMLDKANSNTNSASQGARRARPPSSLISRV